MALYATKAILVGKPFNASDGPWTIGTMVSPVWGPYAVVDVYDEALEHWPSTFVIRIQHRVPVFHGVSPGGNPTEVEKTFKIYLTDAVEVDHKTVQAATYIQPEMDEDHYSVAQQEVMMKQHFPDGSAHLATLRFDMSHVRTEGVFVDNSSVVSSQCQQDWDALRKNFGGTNDEARSISLYVPGGASAWLTQHLWKFHRRRSDYERMYPNQEYPTVAAVDANRPNLDQAKLAPESPSVSLSDRLVFHSEPQMFRILEGGAWQALAAEKRQYHACHSQDSELRFVKTLLPDDESYIGMLRPHSGFGLRLRPGDRLRLTISIDEEWERSCTATVLEKPFKFGQVSDETLDLGDWIVDSDKKKEGSVLGPLFEMQNKPAVDDSVIRKFCRDGPAHLVSVRPYTSETPTLCMVRALDNMNPSKGLSSQNNRWNKMLLGSDLRATQSTMNVFKGIDVFERIAELKINLNESQRAVLTHLTKLSNGYGLFKGPPGTGKTYLDILINIVLVMAGKRCSVQSNANATADHFIREFMKTVDKLGVKLPKRAVRVYVPKVEQEVLRQDLFDSVNERERRGESSKSKNPPKPQWHKTAEEFNRAAKIQKFQKERRRPVPDRRFQVAEYSLNRLVLEVCNLLEGVKPMSNATTTSNVSVTQSGRNSLRSSTASTRIFEPTSISGSSQTRKRLPFEENIASRHEFDMEEENRILTILEADLAAMSLTLTLREKLIAEFVKFFKRVERNDILKLDERKTYDMTYAKLAAHIIEHDVCIVVHTIIAGVDGPVLQRFAADHTTIQEAGHVSPTEEAVVLAQLPTGRGTVHLSGDEQQLGPYGGDDKDSAFGRYLIRSNFARFIALGMPCPILLDSYRSIPLITSIFSSFWYRDLVQPVQTSDDSPNASIAREFHGKIFDIMSPCVMIDIHSQSEASGRRKSKKNEDEVDMVFSLAKKYIREGIEANEIVILTGYTAQLGLLKQTYQWLEDRSLEKVRFSTIDGFQGQESSVIILLLTGTERFGFLRETARLLVACSRAKDVFVIMGTLDQLRSNERWVPEEMRLLKRIHQYFHRYGWVTGKVSNFDIREAKEEGDQ